MANNGPANIGVTLTERQMEILGLVRKGLSNKEIASQLNISERTVKWHIKCLFEIFRVSNRTALAVMGQDIIVNRGRLE